MRHNNNALATCPHTQPNTLTPTSGRAFSGSPHAIARHFLLLSTWTRDLIRTCLVCPSSPSCDEVARQFLHLSHRCRNFVRSLNCTKQYMYFLLFEAYVSHDAVSHFHLQTGSFYCQLLACLLATCFSAMTSRESTFNVFHFQIGHNNRITPKIYWLLSKFQGTR